MRQKYRDFLNAVMGDNLISMFERIAAYATKVQGGPWIPWLNPDLGHAAARRTANRLRSGALDYDDPRLPAPMLADMIDLAIEKDQVLRACVDEARQYRAISESLETKDREERNRSFVAGFHRLKKSPEAGDPEHPVAQRVRRMHRKRRKKHGRPRHR